jgi:hypothetical protein
MQSCEGDPKDFDPRQHLEAIGFLIDLFGQEPAVLIVFKSRFFVCEAPHPACIGQGGAMVSKTCVAAAAAALPLASAFQAANLWRPHTMAPLAPVSGLHRPAILRARSARLAPTMVAVNPADVKEHDQWLINFNHDAFKKDVDELGKRLEKNQGEDDVKHLKKICFWSNTCAVLGLATMWLPVGSALNLFSILMCVHVLFKYVHCAPVIFMHVPMLLRLSERRKASVYEHGGSPGCRCGPCRAGLRSRTTPGTVVTTGRMRRDSLTRAASRRARSSSVPLSGSTGCCPRLGTSSTTTCTTIASEKMPIPILSSAT